MTAPDAEDVRCGKLIAGLYGAETYCQRIPGHPEPHTPNDGIWHDRPFAEAREVELAERASGASPARDGDTAERIVAVAVQIAQTSPMSLREATNALLEVGGVFAERDAAVAALDRVRALHRPIRMAMIGGTELTCSECRREAIHETDVTWPCSTVAALDASGAGQ